MIYSGGVGGAHDLAALAALRERGEYAALAGVIVGRALYEEKLSVAEGIEALRGEAATAGGAQP